MRKNTGNGNDFVYGPAGISKATARDPFNVTHVCRQDESEAGGLEVSRLSKH